VERPRRTTSAFEEIGPVIRMRQGLGKSRACEIEDGSKTALFSPLCVEAHFWLAWDSSDLPRLPRLGLRLGFALPLEIERHGSANEILQGRLIDLVAFVDVDSAPDIPLEAGVE
jgi:hypothetical protein